MVLKGMVGCGEWKVIYREHAFYGVHRISFGIDLLIEKRDLVPKRRRKQS